MREPGPIQRVLRERYERKMRSVRLLTSGELARPAVVFSPHPDDESLACGGTIIRKKQAGADVKVVFLTDGSASHAAFMPADMLRDIRMKEARSACVQLGLSKKDVFFLGFRDQHLAGCRAEAVQKIIDLLEWIQPDEIFIPLRDDPPPDHRATYRFVIDAAVQVGRPLTINEYPVWYWYHWPWVGIRQGRRNDSLGVLKLTLRTLLGARAPCRFNASVDIQPVFEGKRTALAEHRSQTTQLLHGLPWPTLEAVSHGEFLARFFRDREYFYRYAAGSPEQSAFQRKTQMR